MADLLECLLQVKGLRETIDRLLALAAAVDPSRWVELPPGGGPSAADLLARLVEIEIVHGDWLRLMLGSSRPVLAASDTRAALERARRHAGSATGTLGRLLEYRRENLDRLDRCSAADFSRVGVHPTRREMSVADLVALMMASDAECVGEIRRALQSGHSGVPPSRC